MTGIAHVGVLQRLQDENMVNAIETIVGSSAGAVVGALYAVGMTPRSMYDAFFKLDRSKIFRFDNIESFLSEFGLDDGTYFMAHMADLFLSVNVDPRITFGELFQHHRKRLVITGTNTSAHKPEYFSTVNCPEMRVLDAVRISMSIPLLFTVVRRHDGLFVDGAIHDNYPINYCLADFSKRYPLLETLFHVIGCSLASLPPKTTPDLESFIFNVFASTMKKSHFDSHTITVDLENLSSVDFDADASQLKEAYDEGYAAAQRHIVSLRKNARKLITRRRSI